MCSQQQQQKQLLTASKIKTRTFCLIVVEKSANFITFQRTPKCTDDELFAFNAVRAILLYFCDILCTSPGGGSIDFLKLK